MRALLPVAAAVVLAALLFWFGSHASKWPGEAPSHAVDASTGGVREAGAEAPPEVKERVARVHPGEPFRVELAEEPATRYGTVPPTEADRVYEDVLAEVGRPDAVYDANLGRAARELAYQQSLMGTLVPSETVTFLLRSAGAIDRSVTQGYTRTGGEGTEAVRKRLGQMLAGQPRGGVLRVGVGEAYVPGAKQPRYIAMLLSRREVDISPTPRRAQPGTEWVLTGTLPRGYDHASGLVLTPEGRMLAVDVRQAGRRFTATVELADGPGVYDVSVGADGPFGPKPLLQVPVYAGIELPVANEGHMPPDESEIKTIEQAEARALDLLNEDRRRFGLEPLDRDGAADGVARRHSRDMRDEGFFGHVSPNSGSPGDRLAEADYRVGAHAENVALGSSLYGAQAGLLYSLGHRRNILNPTFTHVGIGVAASSDGDRTQWYLTQLFTTPVARIDAAAEERGLHRRMAEARTEEGAGSLGLSESLSGIARLFAPTVAAGGTEGVPEGVMAATKKVGLATGGAYVWVRATTDLATMPLPKVATHADYSKVGIGIVQLEDHPNGLVGVVIVFTGTPR